MRGMKMAAAVIYIMCMLVVLAHEASGFYVSRPALPPPPRGDTGALSSNQVSFVVNEIGRVSPKRFRVRMEARMAVKDQPDGEFPAQTTYDPKSIGGECMLHYLIAC